MGPNPKTKKKRREMTDKVINRLDISAKLFYQ